MPFDGPGITVIGRICTNETKRPRKPLAGILRVNLIGVLIGLPVVAGAPDIDHDERSVFDSVMPFEGGSEIFARQNGLLALNLLVD